MTKRIIPICCLLVSAPIMAMDSDIVRNPNLRLLKATIYNRYKEAKQAIANGATIHKEMDPNLYNVPLLNAAAAMGLHKIVDLLLSNGADPNTFDSCTGETALMRAASGPFPDIIMKLLCERANPNLANRKGKAPLHIVAKTGHAETAQRLIIHGAIVNIRSANGKTPLHIASAGKSATLVSFLLGIGANPDLVDQKGQTPLHKAARIGHPDVVKKLLAVGADVAIVDNHGFSPLDYLQLRKDSSKPLPK